MKRFTLYYKFEAGINAKDIDHAKRLMHKIREELMTKLDDIGDENNLQVTSSWELTNPKELPF